MTTADFASLIAAVASLIAAVAAFASAVFAVCAHRRLTKVDEKIALIVPPTERENGKQHS